MRRNLEELYREYADFTKKVRNTEQRKVVNKIRSLLSGQSLTVLQSFLKEMCES